MKTASKTWIVVLALGGSVGCASETDAVGASREALLPTAAQVDDLGPLPPELDGLRWPETPRTTREVTVSDAAALTREAAVPGTRVRVEGAVGGDARVTADDVAVVADDASSLGRLTIARGVHRVSVQGGTWEAIRLDPPATWWPSHEVRSEWMPEDVWIRHVTIDAPGTGIEIRGRRVVVAHSDVRAARYGVWLGDTGPYPSEDVILYDDLFDAAGPEATVRLVSVHRAAVVANQLRNARKHNLRVHGDSDAVYAADNVLIDTGVMLGRMDGDRLGTVRFEHNVLHHTAPDLFNPDPGIERLVARFNVAYTDVRDAFYGGAAAPTWDVRDNVHNPYEPVPPGVRHAGIRPLDASAGPSEPAPSEPGPSEPSPSEPSPSEPSPREPAPSEPVASALGLADLGPLPPELTGLRWPQTPRVTREVTVTTHAALTAAVSVPGTRVHVRGVIGGDVSVPADDVEILADEASRLGRLRVERAVHRVRLEGGHWQGVHLAVPARWWPTHEVRAEWMVEDVWIDGVTVDAPGSAFEIRGRRIAVTHADVRAARYSVWCGDTDPLRSEDVILHGNVFDSAGPESTVRLVSVLRSATVANRLANTNKHNYRVHGDSDLAYAADNLLVDTGVMLGTMPGDALGTVWFDDNVLHHTAPDLFNPSRTAIARLVARGNVAYTDVWSAFYPGTAPGGWDVRDNQRLAYTPAP
ncbi:MAG TPA: hypothetical protein RMH99_04175 [Sandaracinaceae bacterium LLY-WYZ-13_1]|nr:hypothetical protein [Sandaracinaceae bacterium LLY-WYZ-13_1]